MTAYSKGETADMSLDILTSDMIESDIGHAINENERAEKKGIKSVYALDYMTPISKVMASKGGTTIKFGDDYPCSIEATFEYEYGNIKYLLAPRIID